MMTTQYSYIKDMCTHTPKEIKKFYTRYRKTDIMMLTPYALACGYKDAYINGAYSVTVSGIAPYRVDMLYKDDIISCYTFYSKRISDIRKKQILYILMIR
jgi:hypothetical protein